MPLRIPGAGTGLTGDLGVTRISVIDSGQLPKSLSSLCVYIMLFEAVNQSSLGRKYTPAVFFFFLWARVSTTLCNS